MNKPINEGDVGHCMQVTPTCNPFNGELLA
jgi:hypothetical protein